MKRVIILLGGKHRLWVFYGGRSVKIFAIQVYTYIIALRWWRGGKFSDTESTNQLYMEEVDRYGQHNGDYEKRREDEEARGMELRSEGSQGVVIIRIAFATLRARTLNRDRTPLPFSLAPHAPRYELDHIPTPHAIRITWVQLLKVSVSGLRTSRH